MSIRAGIGVCGFVRMEAHNEQTGQTRLLVDWFKNTVLNVGREQMAQRSNWAGGGSYCHIGTDGTLPLPTDTGLVAWFDSTNATGATEVDGVQGTAPFYGWNRMTYRFPSDTFTVGTNIREVGIGWGPSNAEIFARTVPVDLAGVPTTVSLLPGEALDVQYELRYYPMLGDVKGIAGIAGEAYDTMTRAALVDKPGFQNNAIGNEIEALVGSLYFYANDGDIGDITGSPVGTSDDIDGTPYSLAYTPGSYQRTLVASCGVDGWNVPGGLIRSAVCSTSAGQFQTQFSRQSSPLAGFPKAIDQSAEIRWTISFSAWLLDGFWQRSANDDVTTPSAGQWNMNATQTILRINWADANTDSRREELQVPSGTVFHLQSSTPPDPKEWVEYEVNGAYTEGGDYTEYNIINPDLGPSGDPSSGTMCAVRAVYV